MGQGYLEDSFQEAIGTRHTERGNKRERNKSRVKNFKVGDLVLKKIVNRRNKMGKRWEGPFEILAFDEKQKGYHVREMEGKFLSDLILADQLRHMVELADEESVSWEVVKILNHKGKVGDCLYLVEWKGGFKLTWEPESAIQTTDCIQDYWDAKKKSESKGKKKSSKGSRCGRALFVFCVLIPFLLIKLMKRTCCKRFIGFTPT